MSPGRATNPTNTAQTTTEILVRVDQPLVPPLDFLQEFVSSESSRARALFENTVDSLHYSRHSIFQTIKLDSVSRIEGAYPCQTSMEYTTPILHMRMSSQHIQDQLHAIKSSSHQP
jgi:hypothetical protein